MLLGQRIEAQLVVHQQACKGLALGVEPLFRIGRGPALPGAGLDFDDGPVQLPLMRQQLPEQFRVALALAGGHALQLREGAFHRLQGLYQRCRLPELQYIGLQHAEMVEYHRQAARVRRTIVRVEVQHATGAQQLAPTGQLAQLLVMSSIAPGHRAKQVQQAQPHSRSHCP
ncbi:hypothetical protein D9M71_585400 [compost metagenome]